MSSSSSSSNNSDNQDKLAGTKDPGPWTGEAHVLQTETFSKFTHCNVCGQFIWGLAKQGAGCTDCAYKTHEKCRDTAPETCRPTATYLDETGQTIQATVTPVADNESPVLSHHWLQGNTDVNTHCDHCGKMIQGTGLVGWRCSWCNCATHDRCRDEFVQENPCSPVLKSAIIPPEGFTQIGWRKVAWGNPPSDTVATVDELAELAFPEAEPAADANDNGVEDTELAAAVAEEEAAVAAEAAQAAAASNSSSGIDDPKPKQLNIDEDSTDVPDSASEDAAINVKRVMRITPPENASPIVAFINSKSGGQQGSGLLGKFRRLLNKNQVFDMIDDCGPVHGLDLYKDVPGVRVLVAGGDGTVAWVLSEIDKRDDFDFPVAVLPLGTGNDLARAIGWGGGYEGEDLEGILERVLQAKDMPLDRWSLAFTPFSPETGDMGHLEKEAVMNNYFSIGVEAQVALGFHNKRESAPHLFKSRAVNKYVWYGHYGLKAAVEGGTDIGSAISLKLNGVEKEIPEGYEGIVVVNLQSWAGGTNMWGTPKEKDGYYPQSFSDGIFEVVAVKSSAHLATIKSGLGTPLRLGQASDMEIQWKVDQGIPMQVDGEPWLQQPCNLKVEHLIASRLLVSEETWAASNSSGSSSSK